MCPIFTLNNRVHSAAQTFSDPPISLLTMLTYIPCSSILRSYKLRVEGEGELSLLKMNSYSFVLITRHNFLFSYRIIALKEFWSFLTLYKVFISTLRLDQTVWLLSSYLLGRTRITETGPHVSSRVSINCGVP